MPQMVKSVSGISDATFETKGISTTTSDGLVPLLFPLVKCM